MTGSGLALTDPALRQVFWRFVLRCTNPGPELCPDDLFASRSAKILLIWSLVLVVLLSCVLLPLEWIASLFLSAETIDSTLRAFRYGASTFVPFMLVTLCRYFDVNMFESAFFAGLARRDATLAEQIQKVIT